MNWANSQQRTRKNIIIKVTLITSRIENLATDALNVWICYVVHWAAYRSLSMFLHMILCVCIYTICISLATQEKHNHDVDG